MKRAVLLAALLGGALLAGAVVSGHAVAKPRPMRCHHGYIRKRVGVRVRRDHRWVWKREPRCVRVKAKKPTAPTGPSGPTGPAGGAPPTVSYEAKVDPSFTQAPTNPLAVTYGYSADAIQTAGTVSTDLAAVGQLPAGVLNFYSAQSPGGAESLYCSMNVGGSTAAGSCPITYQGTGTYNVTTQYIPNGAAATTETDAETISPFTTTTTLTATQTSCRPAGGYYDAPYCIYSLTATVTDENGNAVSGPVEAVFSGTESGGAADGQTVSASFAIPPGGSCTIYVETNAVYSPACGAGWSANWYYVPSDKLTGSFAGAPGWSVSEAPSQIVTP